MNVSADKHNEPAGRAISASALRVFRHRNYAIFFSGQTISVIGAWMQTVAQAWLVYRLTGSASLLGLVAFSTQIPVFLFASFGGVVADRYARRDIVVITQTAAMIFASTLAVLTLTGHIQVWHIFVLSVLLGIANAFDIPARQAFVVELVGKEEIVNAIALNSFMFNGARIIGPAVAGVLVASIGEGWCFLANAVSYIPVIIGLMLMSLTPADRIALSGSVIDDITEGFKYCAHTRPVRDLLLLVAMTSIFGMSYAVLMPIFADQILHGGARGLGLLMGASGIGALMGALRLTTRQGAQGLEKWIAFAAAGFGISLVAFALSSSFWLSAALLVPAGFCMIVQTASSNTLIQSMVPDRLRGRVMSVYSIMFMGMAPFGALLAGTVADHFGVTAMVIIGGLVCMAGASAFGLRLGTFSGEARRLISAARAGDSSPGGNVQTEGALKPTRAN